MEGLPSTQVTPENAQEKELPFQEQVVLANILLRSVSERNKFIQMHHGFDDFAEVWQHIGNNRAIYEEKERAVTTARAEFDEKVHDKKKFVEQLKTTGNDILASTIESMFSVPKDTLLSRFFKK